MEIKALTREERNLILYLFRSITVKPMDPLAVMLSTLMPQIGSKIQAFNDEEDANTPPIEPAVQEEITYQL